MIEEKIFYKKLYSSRNLDWETLSGDEKVQQFLENPNLPKLTEEQKTDCESSLTMDECSKALKLF